MPYWFGTGRAFFRDKIVAKSLYPFLIGSTRSPGQWNCFYVILPKILGLHFYKAGKFICCWFIKPGARLLVKGGILNDEDQMMYWMAIIHQKPIILIQHS